MEYGKKSEKNIKNKLEIRFIKNINVSQIEMGLLINFSNGIRIINTIDDSAE